MNTGKIPGVLIVEDRTITAMDLSLIMQRLNFESIIVKSGEEAIEILRNNMPELIIMDVMLKGYYTGIETAQHIRNYSDVPIIFITALTDDETYLKAHLTDPAAIISKPYSEDEIKRVVQTVSRKHYVKA